MARKWGRFALWCIPILLVPLLWLAGPVPPGKAVGRAPDGLFFLFSRLPITNSMVTGWIISLSLIIGVRWAIGRPAAVPTGRQAMVEAAVDGLRALFEPIVGRHALPTAFPLLLTLFVYILIQNWSGLLPGMGAIGLRGASGASVHLLRPAHADLNATVALALVSFAGWAYVVLRRAGLGAFLRETFGNKAERAGVPLPIYYFLGLVCLGVGLVDIVSLLFRVVSLSFRLYGNIFGGENLIGHMLGLVEYLVPVPFYFLELLIGFIQALVFTLLTAVYMGLLTNHGEGER